MDKELLKTGISNREQEGKFVTISREEYEFLKSQAKYVSEQSHVIATIAKNLCQYDSCPYKNNAKNCKPYTGPKVVQMFTKPKSE